MISPGTNVPATARNNRRDVNATMTNSTPTCEDLESDSKSRSNPIHLDQGPWLPSGLATAETGPTAPGEPVLAAQNPGVLRKARDEITAFSQLNPAPPPPNPTEVLREWAADQLSPIKRRIFWELIARKTMKVKEFARSHGTTEGSVHVAMTRTRTNLQHFLQTPEAAPVLQKASEVRRTVQMAMSTMEAEDILGLHPDTEPCRDLFLALGGPYSEVNGWLILKEAASTDPTGEIVDTADEAGRINRKFASYRLSTWGLDPCRHTGFLTRDGRVKEVSGTMVTRGKNLQDRTAIALSQIGQPATVQEILGKMVGKRAGPDHLARLMANDDRFAKAAPKTWALASWNLPVYLGAVHNMREVLEQRAEMSVLELFEIINRTFGIPRSTLEEYVHAPMFVTESGSVRLRNEADPNTSEPPTGPLTNLGTFRLGERRAAKLLRIGGNLLKGTGYPLGDETGALLRIKFNEERTLRTRHGEEVSLTHPETAPKGPLIGSVKAVLERLEARDGDLLTLAIDLTDNSLDADVTRKNETHRDWGTVGRLTGLGPHACPKKLAEALMCRGWESRKVLERRGDLWVAEAMPPYWSAEESGPGPEVAAMPEMTGGISKEEKIPGDENAPLTRKERQRLKDQDWRKTAGEQGLCQQRCGRKREGGSTRCRECNQKQKALRDERKRRDDQPVAALENVVGTPKTGTHGPNGEQGSSTTGRPSGKKNLSDLAVMALDDLGTPATAQDIQEHLGDGVSPKSLHVALSRDPRLVKTGPRLWGLRSWRLPKYQGMVHQMRQVLQERGEMPVGELFQLMSSAYGAGEETLRAAAAKAGLRNRQGTIRLRTGSEAIPARGGSRATAFSDLRVKSAACGIPREDRGGPAKSTKRG